MSPGSPGGLAGPEGFRFPYLAGDIDAVVFDIGGVFTIRDGDLVRRGMANAGFVIDGDAAVFHRAHYVAMAAIAARARKGLEMTESVPDFWMDIERAYLGAVGIEPDRLDEAVAAMRVEVFQKMPKPIWCGLLSGNIAAFHRLAESGMPVAVVSNNDGTAEQQMRDFGVCQVGPGPLPRVAAIVDSGLVGIAKPDPAIFRPALDALGTAAERTLYVGDTLHADVHGAGNAGMPVVQLDPYGFHADFDHARLPDVAALVEVLLGE